MGQDHVNAMKRKTKGEVERLKFRKKHAQRPESQQGLHPTAALMMPRCDGAYNGDNRGSEWWRKDVALGC